MEVEGELDQTFAKRATKAIAQDTELGALEQPISRMLIHAPMQIQGAAGTALADSGADSAFISRKIAQRNDMSASSLREMARDGAVSKITESEGAVRIAARNDGISTECMACVIEIPSTRQMAIGLPDIPKFGFRIGGAPATKLPRAAEIQTLKPESKEKPQTEASPPAKLGKEVGEAVKHNQQMPLISRRAHPLAVLRIQPTLINRHGEA